ncbi:MAG: type I 3-dehydroquinate dehydratase [Lachnospiraceae bacterium]|nr:type I 3-dehydroquinate dehydratase [Lachnospiraceae bacterium]
MKKSFLNAEKPFVLGMILAETPEECIGKIRDAVSDGADAIGFQTEKLKKEFRTKEVFRRVIAEAGDLPVYVTSYRKGSDALYSDEECAEGLLLAAECGATLIDVIGDLFGRSEKWELAEDPEAIEKQKELIERIHGLGAEVLISCHTHKPLTVEENLTVARAQAERGADVIKIVDQYEEKTGLVTAVESILAIRKETGKEVLFLAGGEGVPIREFGPAIGVIGYLAVPWYGPFDPKAQPLLKDAVALRDHFRYRK